MLKGGVLGDNPQTVLALLKAGADLHAKDDSGETALDTAISKELAEIVIVLESWSLNSSHGL